MRIITAFFILLTTFGYALADSRQALIDYLLEDEAAIGKRVNIEGCDLVVSSLHILQCDAKPQAGVLGIIYIYTDRLNKDDRVRAATNCDGQLPVPDCKVNIAGEIVKDGIGMYLKADTIEWIE